MQSRPPLPDWLKPLPVRLFFVLLAAGWSLFEFYNGQMVWGALFAAVTVWERFRC